MKHTPGPWITYETPHGDCIIGIGPDLEPFCDHSVAEVYLDISTDETLDEAEANARLIAAAPELLAALVEIVSRNEVQSWFNLDQARAAIAKATD